MLKYDYELYHHGILGQRWGIRRFQNPDGTRIKLGKKRKQRKPTGKVLARVNNSRRFFISEMQRRIIDDFNRWQIQANEQALMHATMQGLLVAQQMHINNTIMMQNHAMGMF